MGAPTRKEEAIPSSFFLIQACPPTRGVEAVAVETGGAGLLLSFSLSSSSSSSSSTSLVSAANGVATFAIPGGRRNGPREAFLTADDRSAVGGGGEEVGSLIEPPWSAPLSSADAAVS